MIPASVAIVEASRSRSASKSLARSTVSSTSPVVVPATTSGTTASTRPPIDSMYSRSGAGSFGSSRSSTTETCLTQRSLAFRVVGEQVRVVDGIPALRRVVAHRDDLAAHLVPVADPALVDLDGPRQVGRHPVADRVRIARPREIRRHRDEAVEGVPGTTRVPPRGPDVDHQDRDPGRSDDRPRLGPRDELGGQHHGGGEGSRLHGLPHGRERGAANVFHLYQPVSNLPGPRTVGHDHGQPRSDGCAMGRWYRRIDRDL